MRHPPHIIEYASARSSGAPGLHAEPNRSTPARIVMHVSVWSTICTVASALLMFTVLHDGHRYRDGFQLLLSLGWWGALFVAGALLWLFATHVLLAGRIWDTPRRRIAFACWFVATFALQGFIAFLGLVPRY